jgi:hypothetical protein
MAALPKEQNLVAESGMVAVLNKSEIDQQISTARAYPRTIRAALEEAKELVTITKKTAQGCIYALPRKKDGENITIEGPSVRFAEIIAHTWGNCRVGSRVIDESGDFVTAQGVFHDLGKNVAITREVQRRITSRNGSRFNADMIAVTGNAASAIALRNAILVGIPKAFWSPIYEAARKVVMGDAKTLPNQRAEMLQELQQLGATEAMVLAVLGVEAVKDITSDHLVILAGLASRIVEGEAVEVVFGGIDESDPQDSAGTPAADLAQSIKGGAKKSATTKPEEKSEATPPADTATAGGINQAFVDAPQQPDPWITAADKKQAELDDEQEAGLRKAEGGEV